MNLKNHFDIKPLNLSIIVTSEASYYLQRNVLDTFFFFDSFAGSIFWVDSRVRRFIYTDVHTAVLAHMI